MKLKNNLVKKIPYIVTTSLVFGLTVYVCSSIAGNVPEQQITTSSYESGSGETSTYEEITTPQETSRDEYSNSTEYDADLGDQNIEQNSGEFGSSYVADNSDNGSGDNDDNGNSNNNNSSGGGSWIDKFLNHETTTKGDSGNNSNNNSNGSDSNLPSSSNNSSASEDETTSSVSKPTSGSYGNSGNGGDSNNNNSGNGSGSSNNSETETTRPVQTTRPDATTKPSSGQVSKPTEEETTTKEEIVVDILYDELIEYEAYATIEFTSGEIKTYYDDITIPESGWKNIDYHVKKSEYYAVYQIYSDGRKELVDKVLKMSPNSQIPVGVGRYEDDFYIRYKLNNDADMKEQYKNYLKPEILSKIINVYNKYYNKDYADDEGDVDYFIRKSDGAKFPTKIMALSEEVSMDLIKELKLDDVSISKEKRLYTLVKWMRDNIDTSTCTNTVYDCLTQKKGNDGSIANAIAFILSYTDIPVCYCSSIYFRGYTCNLIQLDDGYWYELLLNPKIEEIATKDAENSLILGIPYEYTCVRKFKNGYYHEVDNYETTFKYGYYTTFKSKFKFSIYKYEEFDELSYIYIKESDLTR